MQRRRGPSEEARGGRGGGRLAGQGGAGAASRARRHHLAGGPCRQGGRLFWQSSGPEPRQGTGESKSRRREDQSFRILFTEVSPPVSCERCYSVFTRCSVEGRGTPPQTLFEQVGASRKRSERPESGSLLEDGSPVIWRWISCQGQGLECPGCRLVTRDGWMGLKMPSASHCPLLA